jgi:hypothetical protein
MNDPLSGWAGKVTAKYFLVEAQVYGLGDVAYRSESGNCR